MKNIELNKWNIGISIKRDYARYERGWRVFHFQLLKLIRKPVEGEMIHKKDYKGFWIKFAFWLPIETI